MGHMGMPCHLNEGRRLIFGVARVIPRLCGQLGAPFIELKRLEALRRKQKNWRCLPRLPSIARHGVDLSQEKQMLAWFVPPVVVPAPLVLAIAVPALRR
jgi:hypothetical protein